MEEQVEYERLSNIDDNDNSDDVQKAFIFDGVPLMRKDHDLYKTLNFSMIEAIGQLLEGVYMAQDVSSDLMSKVCDRSIGLNSFSCRSLEVDFMEKYDSIHNKLESINSSFKSLLSDVKELHDLVYSDYNERIESIIREADSILNISNYL
ncbi:hypothetical protein [Porphyromonas somerae]|uniref:hypothetical protein n=1 Tax=Porphyromonas somerae TaxID=322095 RepID=UPI001FCC48D4|nr:hypothetical protein [Porphyromonas somerae]BDE81866.1 hypothetical protein CE91St14_08940 [Porphyromonas somerae]